MTAPQPAEARVSFGAHLREAERARLLRRADWRFLLPQPIPERVWCVGDGELLDAVQAVSLSQANIQALPNGDCDLAVLSDPDEDQLRRAWAALHPGGSCYVEWRSSAPRPAGLRARLQHTGFEGVRGYVPWRSPPRAYLWLPLGSTGALRYFLTRPVPGETVLRRALYAVRRAATALVLRLGLVRPLCMIARKPEAHPLDAATAGGPGRLSHDVPPAHGELEILAYIRSEWRKWNLEDAPRRLSWVLRTGGWRSTAKVVAFVIAEPEPRPRLVVKMSRVPESIPSLRREAEILEQLEAIRPGGVPGVPRLLFSRPTPHWLAIGQTAENGTPVANILTRSNYRDLALKATRWLLELAVASRGTQGPSAWDEVVEPALDDFGRTFGAVLESGMLRDTRALLLPLRELPTVCEHRDFIPWNVLLGKQGALGVIDWEAAELRGLPALDLIYFLSYLGFTLDRALPPNDRMIQSYRRGIRRSTFTGAVHSECLSRYVAELGIDPDALRPLRLFTWVLHSRYEYRRLIADYGTSPPADVLRRSVMVRLWMEEIRHGVDDERPTSIAESRHLPGA